MKIENNSFVKIIMRPLQNLKIFAVPFILMALVFSLLLYKGNREPESVCNIKFNIIASPTGALIGVPQFRLNKFLDLVGKTKIDDVVMRLYQNNMTILAKGRNVNDLRNWFEVNMPKYFELEYEAYKFYFVEYAELYPEGPMPKPGLGLGISKNTKHILENMQCFEKNKSISSKAIIVLIIFVSFLSTLVVYVFEKKINTIFSSISLWKFKK